MIGLVLVPLWAATGATVLATDVGDASPVSWLINYGVAGVVILLLVTGQLRTKAEVANLEKQINEHVETIRSKDQALTALMGQLASFMPQLAKVGEIVEALPKAPESLLVDRLEALGRRLDDIQTSQSRGGQR